MPARPSRNAPSIFSRVSLAGLSALPSGWPAESPASAGGAASGESSSAGAKPLPPALVSPPWFFIAALLPAVSTCPVERGAPAAFAPGTRAAVPSLPGPGAAAGTPRPPPSVAECPRRRAPGGEGCHRGPPPPAAPPLPFPSPTNGCNPQPPAQGCGPRAAVTSHTHPVTSPARGVTWLSGFGQPASEGPRSLPRRPQLVPRPAAPLPRRGS